MKEDLNQYYKPNLRYNSSLRRNLLDNLLSLISIIFTIIAICPLILVLSFIFIKGGSHISFTILSNLPEPPGDDLSLAGGIGNAIVGTLIVTLGASFISVPIGIGGGIYLAEYSRGRTFAKFIRFGTNILAGVPSIIAGVFVYGIIVSTKIIIGSTYSAIAGSIALSILMLPTIIKTTDEGLKLVPDDLRKGSYGLGASKFTTITKITLPSAIPTIATGILLSIARAAGETAPLIFTALFSFYWFDSPQAILEPIASLSVLIYNFALEPYASQNELAWAASFVLVMILLVFNVMAKLLQSANPAVKRTIN
tara:strand:- start:10155 stop:11084 length:930 start_codon:yes stop_codon:yes gene_type:complete